MSAPAVSDKRGAPPNVAPATKKDDECAPIPDVIEEKRKDADGRIVVVNRYNRGKLLGKGGFAKCFVGTTPSDRLVALKIVDKGSLIKARAKAKLQTEIAIHKTLSHTNVVKFQRFFEDHTHVYIILELANNNSMSELMKRRKTLLEPEVRYYTTQIIDALKYLHGNLVIHRDLKLGNLFIDHEMRVKVGDFGLATKLAHPNERKRTVCGTPNYIAPEILEGKEGHSFEVDVWSTGVLIFTLLFGKPPFESKDVKATYKRILSNNYAFPDPSSSPEAANENSKALIRHMLQNCPENRPSLDGIMNSDFFGTPAYTPTFLPTVALKSAPNLPNETTQHPAISSSLGAKQASVYSSNTAAQGSNFNRINDENDPKLINHKNKGSNDVYVPLKQQQAMGAVHKPLAVARSSHNNMGAEGSNASSTNGAGSRKPLTRIEDLMQLPSSSATSTAADHNGASSSGSSQQQRTIVTRSQVSQQQQQRGNRFDIYQDNKAAQRGVSSKSNSTSNYNPVAAPSSTSDDMMMQTDDASTRQSVTNARRASLRSAGSNSTAGSTVVPPFLAFSSGPSNTIAGTTNNPQNMEFNNAAERVNSQHNNVPSGPDNAAADVGVVVQFDEAENNGHGHGAVRSHFGHLPKQAWGSDDHNDNRPAQTHQAQAAAATRGSNVSAGRKAAVAAPTVSGAAQTQQQLFMSPPKANVINALQNGREPNTLEAMHDNLHNRFSGPGTTSATMDLFGSEDVPAHMSTGAAAMPPSVEVPPPAAKRTAADVWVIRYVDYTSKYGLGFLLNNGVAGVYFNDNTKIALTASGTTFQYIERKRRNATINVNNSATHNIQISGEHVYQTHPLHSYPAEMQKKVTLLKHFRNYLVEQQRIHGEGGNTDAADQNGLFPASVATGSCASAQVVPEQEEYIRPDGTVTSAIIPFLKKWVKTRHAILFRLSNKTVQVVFFDKSEILLTAEAHIITYVSKDGCRSEHSLHEALQSGRVDVIKRLKYAKDIMYKLINIQSANTAANAATTQANGSNSTGSASNAAVATTTASSNTVKN